MTALLLAFAALLFVFLIAVGAIGWWVARTMRSRQTVDDRQTLLTLAARAAGDESGRGLLVLLRALDEAAPNQPVTVGWLARRTAQDVAPGFLVKIAWDGNEWRRAQPAAQLRAAIEARLAEDPALEGPQARRLLADLRASDDTAQTGSSFRQNDT